LRYTCIFFEKVVVEEGTGLGVLPAGSISEASSNVRASVSMP